MGDASEGERSRPSSMRQRSGTSRNMTYFPDHVQDSVRAGLQSAAVFRAMDSTEEVAEWLRAIGMASYIPEFRAQSVTGSILLSLNSVELQKSLGVTGLKDRRVLLDSICYLKQVLSIDTRKELPEDGRILTHLSNERLFLVWLRFCIVMQTVAVATLRLVDLTNRDNERSVTMVSAVIVVVAIMALVYAGIRYLWMHRIIEQPGVDTLPDKVMVLIPALFLFIGAVIALYGLMSHSAEESAMLVLLSI